MNSPCLVEKFIEDRKHLRKKYPTTWGKVKFVAIDCVPVLEIPSPQLLAGFFDYLKYQTGKKV